MVERVRAVALIVTNPGGEILVLQEFVSKPQLDKYAGMFSIPMETCRPGESDLSVLRRLHKEELPGLPLLPLLGDYVGAYRVTPGAWARLYAMATNTCHLPVISDDRLDVGNHRWVSVQEAFELWLRRGAFEMIEDHAAGRRNVLRRTCHEVKRGLVRA